MDYILFLSDDERRRSLFEDDSLKLEKKATFILGKNGTGKTTLTDTIALQSSEYETHVFKGFDNIIDKNEKLNAVVLGEENTLINKQIKEIEERIEEKNKDKEIVLATLSKSDCEGVSNFWTRLNEAEKDFKDATKTIKDFHTQSAAKIRENEEYRLSSSYNKNNLEREISKASRLSEQERLQLEDTLKSTVKVAKDIVFPVYDVGQLLIDVNLSKELLELTEGIAANVHDVWAAGRIAEGWTLGLEKNAEKKTTPLLIPYDELPESEKEYDRNTALETLKLIIKMGYRIER